MEITIAIIAGLILGTLVNYLADVLPTTRRLTQPTCLACSAPQTGKAYLLFQPCHSCGKKRSLRTWVVQLGLPVAAAWMYFAPSPRLGLWMGLGVLAFFTLIAVIDLEYRLVMHPVSITGAIVGLCLGTWQHGLLRTLEGGAAGFGAMFALYYFGYLFTKLMARIRHQQIEEVALGFGDVNLSGVIGLLVGWPEIIGALLIAILLGGLVSALIMAVMLALKRYQSMTAIPYAPFLLVGASIYLFFAIP